MICICPNCGYDLPADFKRIKPQTVRLRSQCLPALKLLVESNRSMTAKELSRFFKHDETMAQDIEDHFCELRHWRLIEKDGEKCRATERGKLWVAGNFLIPDAGYTVNGIPVDWPADAPEPKYVSFNEMAPPPPINLKEPRPISTIQQTLLTA